MLILTSNGLSSEILFTEVSKLIPNHAKTAVIVTTAAQYKEGDKSVPRLKLELESLGLDVSFADIDTDKPDILQNFDVTEFIGGNPYYLLNSMNTCGCKNVLRRIMEEKTLIGISAGSIVMQDTIAIMEYFDPFMNSDVGLKDFTGMGLTSINIVPHVSKFIEHYDNFDMRTLSYEKDFSRKLTFVDDGHAVIIEENGYRLI